MDGWMDAEDEDEDGWACMYLLAITNPSTLQLRVCMYIHTTDPGHSAQSS